MRRRKLRKAVAAAALGAMLSGQVAAPIAWADGGNGRANGLTTVTPIKHLIVLIGDNCTFDHVFATYQPKHGQTVGNLLSRGDYPCRWVTWSGMRERQRRTW